MEGKFRFGIMGAGNITRQFCDAVQRTGIAVVAAVAGRTPGKAAKLAGEFQIPGVYEDYEEMLKKEQLDAVLTSKNVLVSLEAAEQFKLAFSAGVQLERETRDAFQKFQYE